VTLGLCSQRELDAVVAKAAKKVASTESEDAETIAQTPSEGTSDRERLIEELRAERAEEQKAAAEAAQEAEAAAWLENKRASEAEAEG
jgi:hypothetical protein